MTSKDSCEQGEMCNNAYKLFVKLLKGIILHTYVSIKQKQKVVFKPKLLL